jgi:acid phosphatase (class A)
MKPEAGVFTAMALALAVAACAAGPVAPAAPEATASVVDPAAMQKLASTGFLTPETTPDATLIIPPAPMEGDARNDADWALFRYTRALEGSDRWALAQNDNSYKAADILKDYSCAVDAELTPENVPTLSLVLSRAAVDSGSAAARAKQVYKRTRPYLHNPGNICIPKTDALSKSYDYPSGHSSLSWVQGLILAQLAPDRSTQILQRARGYGESRIVCGVHNWSAVEGGRTNAAGVFAALQGSPEFQKAMAQAGAELRKARASGRKPDAAACATEARLTRPLFTDLTVKAQ